jgi:hypothetical protein
VSAPTGQAKRKCLLIKYTINKWVREAQFRCRFRCAPPRSVPCMSASLYQSAHGDAVVLDRQSGAPGSLPDRSGNNSQRARSAPTATLPAFATGVTSGELSLSTFPTPEGPGRSVAVGGPRLVKNPPTTKKWARLPLKWDLNWRNQTIDSLMIIYIHGFYNRLGRSMARCYAPALPHPAARA